jgi:maltodextrin utilization protein YvdJ
MAIGVGFSKNSFIIIMTVKNFSFILYVCTTPERKGDGIIQLRLHCSV